MAAPRKKPSRQWQVCPKCNHRAGLSGASGPCLCPRCLLQCKWVDMVVGPKPK
jgi:hypothetical protein